MRKVVLVGCGNVGMSYVYALLNQRTSVDEVVLIDLNKDRVEGEVLDLSHGLSFSPSKIKFIAGEYSDCHDADIVVIAAGANQNPGETRMDLINKNSKIFKSITSEYGSFYSYLCTFSENKIYYEVGKTRNELSDKISNNLIKRGMKFVGTTIIYSYLQAIGIIYSHEKDCYLYKEM